MSACSTGRGTCGRTGGRRRPLTIERRTPISRSAPSENTSTPPDDGRGAGPQIEAGRGRTAEKPTELPASGWKDVLLRVKEEIARDNVTIVAAGIAFYLFLALFPALFATVSIYGLVASPGEVERQIAALSQVVPPGALDLLEEQLTGIVRSSPSALGWGAALSILLAIWSSAKGAKAMIGGVNIAYDERETRGFVKLQGLALLFTLGFVVFFALAVGAIAVLPPLLEGLALSPAAGLATRTARWVLLFALILTALGAIYRYSPDRDDPRWRWVSVGSVVAAVLWLIASFLFAWYAESFGSFNETYGAIAGAVVLLMWLQISCFVVLLGAELNSEIEHQTAVDSTRGEPEPMGERGAVKADTLGETQG